MFDSLIGARLLSMDDSGFSVQMTNGEVRNYEFCECEGDCCGFNEFSAKLLISGENMPAITSVKTEERDLYDTDCKVITFFGLDKKLAEIDSPSSSGSGWNYGATVWVKCKETGETETITSW